MPGHVPRHPHIDRQQSAGLLPRSHHQLTFSRKRAANAPATATHAATATQAEPAEWFHEGEGALAPGQALAMVLPGIGSASAAREAGAPNGSAKYCVSCTTCPWANSMMLTE